MISFKTPSKNLPAETGENQEIPQSEQPDFRPRIVYLTCGIQRNANPDI
jgi:hypothetical protein